MKRSLRRYMALMLALLCLTAGCAQHEAPAAVEAAQPTATESTEENENAPETGLAPEGNVPENEVPPVNKEKEPTADGKNEEQNLPPASETVAPESIPETGIAPGENATDEDTAPETAPVNGASSEEPAFSPPGSWRCYLPASRQDVLWLELRGDGSFSVTVDEDSILWAWERQTPFFTYTGRWNTAEDGAFTLLPEETNDPFFEGWSTLGDYRFTRLTDCDGDELAELRQLNNGEGLYTRFFLGEKPWLFCRGTENRDAEEPEKNAVFTARVWKIAYEPTFRLWTETVTVDDDGLVRDPSGRCAVYEVKSTESTSLLSGGPEGLLALGNTVYRFETDNAGRIVTADSVYVGPAPAEEEALFYLERTQDARAYLDAGMRVLCEGSGRIPDGMFVTFLTLGTDSEEQFVREIRYAVNPEGSVLRYDPVSDEWSRVD